MSAPDAYLLSGLIVAVLGNVVCWLLARGIKRGGQ